MVVSLNTSLALNSSTGIARGNSPKGSARFSAPVCDSVSFEGSEAKSPLKSFLKKATMIGAFVTAGLGFTSCDPTNGPDVPDIKPPVVTVDPDAGLTAFDKEVKNAVCAIAGVDSTMAGRPDSLYYNAGLTGANIGMKYDAAKSTDKTAVFRFVLDDGEGIPQGYGTKEFSKAADGSIISKNYLSKKGIYNDPEQVYENTTVFKKGASANTVLEQTEEIQNIYTPIAKEGKSLVQRIVDSKVKAQAYNVNKYISFLK